MSYEYKELIIRKNGGERSITNVSTCTNKEVTKRSAYRIGMNRGISQHTPSMRCAMREKTPKIIRKKRQWG